MDPAEIQVQYTHLQPDAFCTQVQQTRFKERIHRFLRTEGFGTVASLYEMDDDILDPLVSNARKPTGSLPADPTYAEKCVANPNFTILYEC